MFPSKKECWSFFSRFNINRDGVFFFHAPYCGGFIEVIHFETVFNLLLRVGVHNVHSYYWSDEPIIFSPKQEFSSKEE